MIKIYAFLDDEGGNSEKMSNWTVSASQVSEVMARLARSGSDLYDVVKTDPGLSSLSPLPNGPAYTDCDCHSFCKILANDTEELLRGHSVPTVAMPDVIPQTAVCPGYQICLAIVITENIVLCLAAVIACCCCKK